MGKGEASHEKGGFRGIETALAETVALVSRLPMFSEYGDGRLPLTPFQVHGPVQAKKHSLCLQQRSLGTGGVGIKAGFRASKAVHHPMTWNGSVLSSGHGIAHGPGTAGHPSKASDLAIGGHFPGGNLADDGVKDSKDAHFSRTS